MQAFEHEVIWYCLITTGFLSVFNTNTELKQLTLKVYMTRNLFLWIFCLIYVINESRVEFEKQKFGFFCGQKPTVKVSRKAGYENYVYDVTVFGNIAVFGRLSCHFPCTQFEMYKRFTGILTTFIIRLSSHTISTHHVS